MRRGLTAALWLGSLVLPVLTSAPARADSGVQWIWTNDGDPATDASLGSRYFRRAFAVGRFADDATLDITADNAFTVWVNGTKVGSGDDWKKVYRFDVKPYIVDGKNVIAVEAQHTRPGPAGLMVRLGYVPNGQSRLAVFSDGSWKASDAAPAGWEAIKFDDANWAHAKVLGPYGKTGRWTGQVWEGGGDDRFTVPKDFRVEAVAKNPDPKDPFSLINLCFDTKGRLYVSREGGPILLCTQPDKDGAFRNVKPYCTQVRGCQGMCWVKDALFLVGDGPQGTGLYRCRDTKGADQIDDVTLLHKFKGSMGEHGPHAVLHGPDGKLYLCIGNHAWAQPEKLAANSPLTRWPTGGMGPDQGQPNTTEDVLLPRLNDARGHAANILAPGGTIWRFNEDGTDFALVAAGFRNHFDAAFSPDGELFTFDSDMEWDEALPWYRPVRVCHCPPGADFVWRTGAANTPNYYIDSLPPIAETGRGSPVGMDFYAHHAFPAKYRGALFLGDWSLGIIWAVHLKPDGASYAADVEKFCTGAPMNVTDLAVGPDGAIYFTMGGRGTQGGVYRIRYDGKAEPATGSDQPLAAWSPKRDEVGTIQDIKALYAASRNPDPIVRASATEQLGRLGGGDAQEALLAALHDRSPLVRRRACEAFIRAGIEPPVDALKPLLADGDRFLRTAARLVLQRIDPKKWAADLLHGDSDLTALEAIVALCKTNKAAGYTEPIFERLHHQSHDGDAGVQLNYLRVVQLALVHCPPPRGGNVRGIAVDLLGMFPHEDARVNRELAILLTDLRREKVLDEPVHAKLLDALLADAKDRQQQIHYFYCLRLLHEGWTTQEKQRLVAWYEATRTWKGGHSFTPFLENILRDLAPAFTAEDRAGIFAKAEHMPITAAALLHAAKPEQLPPAVTLADLYTRLKLHGQAIEKAAELRQAVVDALTRSPDSAVQPVMRRIGDEEPALRDAVARVLARYPGHENYPYLLHGLESPNPVVVNDVVVALAKCPDVPKADDPAPYRLLLNSSRRLGSQNLWRAVEVLRHWTGGRQFGFDKDTADRELAAWVRWYGQAFPKGPALAVKSSVSTPEGKYKYADLLDYLTKDPAGTKGDAARGKTVFSQAQCAKCHKYGSEGEGVGPELTTLSKRFKRADTLESIVFPSKVISDQYRSTTILTKKGVRIDGLAAVQGDTLTVLQSDGSKVTLRKDEVEAQYASLVSVMPENLLDPLSKQEIADLFAFLESDVPAPK
ncbi:MAG TPA: HEAT repeat domain-containing protein [Gemmataceae bacterium]|jgi:putative heme-binding domain-containing protein